MRMEQVINVGLFAFNYWYLIFFFKKKSRVIIIFVIFPDILILLFLKYSCREEDSESEKDKKVWYYSTKIQLAELIECLDKDYWEADLCKTLEEMREEVHRHMDVTEDLTNKARGTNKSFLSAANGKHILSNGNNLESNSSLYLFYCKMFIEPNC